MTPAPHPITIKRGVTFGPLVINCYSDAAQTVPVNLTGWSPFAQVRKKAGDTTVVRDLSPTITNAATGTVTIPEITDEQTLLMTVGSFRWDLILQTPSGQRLGPYLAGSFKVADVVTTANR